MRCSSCGTLSSISLARDKRLSATHLIHSPTPHKPPVPLQVELSVSGALGDTSAHSPVASWSDLPRYRSTVYVRPFALAELLRLVSPSG